MRPIAFSRPGQFHKGNLHAHCTMSDGLLDAAEVCRRYKEKGYDFIALTDHFVGRFGYPLTDTRPFRDDQFTTLIGAELHSGSNSLDEIWHILAVGLPLDFAPPNAPGFVPTPDQESGSEIARRAADAGAFVAIAHPEWSGLTEADMASIDAAHAVEIYNHGCEVECDRGGGSHHADVLARQGRRLSFIATDDSHFINNGMDAFGGWVMVKSETNEPEALLQALKDGAMYSSTGPDFIDLKIEGNDVIVHSSPVNGVVLQGQSASTIGKFSENMTHTRLDTDRLAESPWLRVILMDKAGNRAWSNPIWVK